MRLIDYISDRDRFLSFPWMGTAGLRLCGCKLYDVYLSPPKQLEIARQMDQEFDADFSYPMDDGAIFVDTLGLPLLKPDYDFPSVLENPIKSRADLESLALPNLYADGRIPVHLEALKLIAAAINKPLALSVQGPFTLAVELVGATDFVRAIIRNPDFIERVLDFTNQLVGEYARAAVKMGVRFLCICEPTAVILSPARFEKMVAGRLRELYSSLDPGVWKVLHICGDTSFLLPQMLACGAEGLSLDQVMDLPMVIGLVPKDIVILGNLDPVQVLREFPPDQVREQTLELLRSMKGHSNYMFSFGCDCTPDTPLDNIRAAMDASRTLFRDL
ncbi:MAG: uroporphyrinogen decarboxylase family protein [Syntrophomonas sp.]